MKVSGEKEPYLEFLRELVIEMFIVRGKAPLRTRELAFATETIQYDGKSYWIIEIENEKASQLQKKIPRGWQDERYG